MRKLIKSTLASWAATTLAAIPIIFPIGGSAARADTAPQLCVSSSQLYQTLTWTPPADTSRLTGYEIQWNHEYNEFVSISYQTVGLDQTSASVPVDFGLNFYTVFAETATGPDFGDVLGSAQWTVGRPPGPAYWNRAGPTAVGNGTITVFFTVPLPDGTKIGYSGYAGPVTEVISDGQTSQTFVGRYASDSATFTGLTNGQPYVFTGESSNACGSVPLQTSPPIVPGIAPEWTTDSPPLVSHPGNYSYRFQATGDPAPAYQLLNAPTWLHINKNGAMGGTIPFGTTSFSYTVVASNNVGIGGATSHVYAGPFTVTIQGHLTPRQRRAAPILRSEWRVRHPSHFVDRPISRRFARIPQVAPLVSLRPARQPPVAYHAARGLCEGVAARKSRRMRGVFRVSDDAVQALAWCYTFDFK
jgi:hypothetical protein